MIRKCSIGALMSSYQMKIQNRWSSTILDFSFCDSGGIQTHNLLIRSQMLYSVELRNHPYLCIISLTTLGKVIPAGFKPTTF